MRKYFVIILFLFYRTTFAQSDSAEARIILIGDAGKLINGLQPVVDAAGKLILIDHKTTILYLGDNLYKTGREGEFLPGNTEANKVLDAQINIAKGTGAKVFFIPGEHNWKDRSGRALENVKREEAYINNVRNKNVQFLPAGGCPGPVEYPINQNITLIVYDSEWFIGKGQKPGLESDCPNKTPRQFYNELDQLLSKNSDKLIILAGHHTLKSYGIHGGYFNLKQHIFPLTDYNPNLWIPLPVIGSVYPIARVVFNTPEDLHYPAYANMINDIEKVVKPYPNVIFVGGHEHNLQLIRDSAYYYIVSGAGSKKTRVSSNKKVLYGEASLGFATLDISKNKKVQVNFYTVRDGSATPSFTKNLFTISSLNNKKDSTEITPSTPLSYFKDSVKVAINTNYNAVGGLHTLISGENYREEWATPVHLKIFRIDQEMGGFTIKETGGERETQSVILIGKDGREWILRTVDKDPQGVLPEALKGFIAETIAKDMISAQAPYAALVIPALASAANIFHTNPKYYFVPDDPLFGDYRPLFANKVCLLELINPSEVKSELQSTANVIDKMISNSKNQVNQEAVLRARLLDMVIGDWDRNFEQWNFWTKSTGEDTSYYPIPKDRDQAFFNSDGLLIKAVSLVGLSYLQGFKKNYRDIKSFNWKEKDFDRIFMNNLDAEKWEKSISRLQQDINDAAIKTAIKGLPPQIDSLHGITIADKLKSRRDLLYKKGMDYYRFLASEVSIPASNKNEFFKILKAGKGLQVKVYQRDETNDTSTVIYDRKFNAKETKYVNLYGLNGNDIFWVDSNTHSKIKLRIIGGKGNDTFHIMGNVRNKIFDYSREKNFIASSSRTKNEISASPGANQYDIGDFKYNSFNFPLINLGYNKEDKLLIGVGFSLKRYAFRKEPFSSYQKLFTLFSYSSRAYQLKYTGEFNQLMHNNDLVVHGEFHNPVLGNFYGLGNLTEKDKDHPREFYHIRYKYIQGEVLLRKKYFNNLLQVYFGPRYFHYWNKYADNENKILAHPSLAGLDSASIYNGKSYVGAKLAVVINNLNNELLPTRGVIWNTRLSSMFGTNNNSHPITKLTSDLQVYACLLDPAKLVAILRFGGGHIFNDDYEYFQALNLGDNNFLRGFRKNRFAGKSLLYQTTELRVKLFESTSYLFPGAVGLIVFHEAGRVWVKGESTHKWHHDFGGGFYYSPYHFALLSATMAHSEEDNLFNFSIGTKFNLIF